jgi:hypothetical protein
MRLGRIAARVGSVQLRHGYQKKGRKTSRRASKQHSGDSSGSEMEERVSQVPQCHNATADIGIMFILS